MRVRKEISLYFFFIREKYLSIRCEISKINRRLYILSLSCSLTEFQVARKLGHHLILYNLTYRFSLVLSKLPDGRVTVAFTLDAISVSTSLGFWERGRA